LKQFFKATKGNLSIISKKISGGKTSAGSMEPDPTTHIWVRRKLKNGAPGYWRKRPVPANKGLPLKLLARPEAALTKKQIVEKLQEHGTVAKMSKSKLQLVQALMILNANLPKVPRQPVRGPAPSVNAKAALAKLREARKPKVKEPEESFSVELNDEEIPAIMEFTNKSFNKKEMLTVGNGLVVKKSTIQDAGNGLFLDLGIKVAKNAIVTYYEGKEKYLDELPKDPHLISKQNKMQRLDSHWITLASMRSVVIGSDDSNPQEGIGGASFINDARDRKKNNAKFVVRDEVENGGIFLKSKRDIQPGEELFVSYGKNYWKKEEMFRTEMKKKEEPDDDLEEPLDPEEERRYYEEKAKDSQILLRMEEEEEGKAGTMEDGVIYPVVVKASNVHGKGLFTARDVKAGEILAPYNGRIIEGSQDILETAMESEYVARINDEVAVDAKNSESLGKYVNSLRKAEREKGFKLNADWKQQDGKLFIKARYNLPSNTELFISYGSGYWATHMAMERKKTKEMQKNLVKALYDLAKSPLGISDNGIPLTPTSVQKLWKKLKELGVAKTDTFVDVGCGVGNVLMDAAFNLVPEGTAIGIEIEEEQLIVLQELLEKEAPEDLDKNMKSLFCYVGDAISTDFLEGLEDAVIYQFRTPKKVYVHLLDLLDTDPRMKMLVTTGHPSDWSDMENVRQLAKIQLRSPNGSFTFYILAKRKHK
jgi:hypothetical protein